MNFILKALIRKQLKGVPDDQIDMMIELVEKNPDFFQKIAEEVKAKTATGMNEKDAAMEVMKSHQSELTNMFPKGKSN